MRPDKDPLYRTACQIHRRLQKWLAERVRPGEQPLQRLADVCGLFDRGIRRRKLARERGWEFAADKIHADLLHRVRQIQDIAPSIPLTEAERPPAPPPPSMLYPELRQLYREFEEVDIDVEHFVVSATTQPIELEGVRLGAFSIELQLRDLVQRPHSYCFQLVALEPHPAYSNSLVTHPHVQDQRLCAGDAGLPIQRALADGRLCEAFLLVRAVLNTYNRDSPFVSLCDWGGARCTDCNATVSRDELYCCAQCQRRVCGDCIGICNVCHRSCCHRCLELDEISAHDCCPDCRQLCASCGRTVDANNIDADRGLCPGCASDEEDAEPELDSVPDQAQTTATPQPEGVIMNIVCSCATDQNYSDNVYAVIQLTGEQAGVLLALRGVFEAARAASPSFPLRALQVWDPRPEYVHTLGDEYAEACENGDLTEWHAVAVDPSAPGTQAHVDGDVLVVAEEGLRWQVNPSISGYQLIETDTLRWGQLECLVAGRGAFPLLDPGASDQSAAGPNESDPQLSTAAA